MLASPCSPTPSSTTPTERVVARLVSEGWVRCSGLEFPALCQASLLPCLRTFVLHQLQQTGNRMWETDLQLEVLVFSIPAHEFQVHPHLEHTLQNLQQEELIELREVETRSPKRPRKERFVSLKATCTL